MAQVVRLVTLSLVLLDLTYVVAFILNDAHRKELLDAHNYFRRKENATNIRLMRWDCNLEQWAAKYLKKCMLKYDHSTGRNSKEAVELYGFDSAGENIYWIPSLADTSKPEGMTNLTKGVEYWWNERKDYNRLTHTCQPNKECGHYKQVLWANTYAVGCAVTRCFDRSWDDRDFVLGRWTLFCEYGRTGLLNGECPYMARKKEEHTCKYASTGRFEFQPWKGPEDCAGCFDSVENGRYKGEKKIEWTKHCLDGLCSDTPEPPAFPKCTGIVDTEDSPSTQFKTDATSRPRIHLLAFTLLTLLALSECQ